MMDAVGDKVDKPRTLTPRQAAFAKMVADGASQTDAYRACYNANAKPNSLRVLAHRVAKNPKVHARIEELKGNPGRAPDEADKRLTKEWVVQRLQDEAANLKNSPATRVRALELLGKRLGMFEDTTVLVRDRSAGEIEQEIKERLAALLGKAKDA